MDKTSGIIMDRDHVKGAPDKAKAAIKDAVGKVRGDSDLQAEGKFEKAKDAAAKGFSDTIGATGCLSITSRALAASSFSRSVAIMMDSDRSETATGALL
jgi:uncharacterized protein YjbJ (UPF0337 family)